LFSEDNPMLMSFRNLVLSSAALCATAAFAAEQKRVEVPFAFVAKNHTYQAGSYGISVDSTNSFVTLSAIGRTSRPLTWILVPGDGNLNHSNASLTFDVTRSGNVLRTIQYQSLSTPNLNKMPKQTVEGSTTIGE
jgi:hypothetical protein